MVVVRAIALLLLVHCVAGAGIARWIAYYDANYPTEAWSCTEPGVYFFYWGTDVPDTEYYDLMVQRNDVVYIGHSASNLRTEIADKAQFFQTNRDYNDHYNVATSYCYRLLDTFGVDFTSKFYSSLLLSTLCAPANPRIAADMGAFFERSTCGTFPARANIIKYFDRNIAQKINGQIQTVLRGVTVKPLYPCINDD